MDLITIYIIALGLSMDSFAVCISQSVCRKKFYFLRSLKIALVFGIFQGLMPLIGYLLGLSFSGIIERFDHWIAFAILGFIGIKMIYEGLKPADVEKCDENALADTEKIQWKKVFILSFATSIDALATGLIFVPYPSIILKTIIIIAAVCLVFSFFGMLLGTYFGKKINFNMEIIGGIVLIMIGIKILIEHLIA